MTGSGRVGWPRVRGWLLACLCGWAVADDGEPGFANFAQLASISVGGVAASYPLGDREDDPLAVTTQTVHISNSPVRPSRPDSHQLASTKPGAIQASVRWNIVMRPGKRRELDKTRLVDDLTDQPERLKASIRAKVEHPFRVTKRQFGHVKVRYRSLAKNTAQLHTLFALSNLWMAR